MRQLTDEEMSSVFEKLKKFLGSELKRLMNPEDEETPLFRMIGRKVYFCEASLVKFAAIFGKDKLMNIGLLLGQFSKKGKFRLGITALSLLAKYTNGKVWLKNSGEQNFLYGNHGLTAHIARISDDTIRYSGVVVYNLANVPLGFGVLAKNPIELKQSNPSSIFVFNQADTGEYLRVEGGREKAKNQSDDEENED